MIHVVDEHMNIQVNINIFPLFQSKQILKAAHTEPHAACVFTAQYEWTYGRELGPTTEIFKILS